MKKLLLLVMFFATICSAQTQDNDRYANMEFKSSTWTPYGIVINSLPFDMAVTTEEDSLIVIESPDFRISALIINRDNNSETSVGQYIANMSSNMGLKYNNADIQYVYRYDGLANGIFICGDIVDDENKPFYLANAILTLQPTRHFVYLQVITRRELANYANNIILNYDIDLSQYNDSEATSEHIGNLGDGTIVFRDAYIALMQNTSLSFNINQFTHAMQILEQGFQLVYTRPTYAINENLIEPEISFVSNDHEYAGRINNYAGKYYFALYKITDGVISFIPQLLCPCEADENFYDMHYFINNGDFQMDLVASSQAAPGDDAAAPVMHLKLDNSPVFSHIEFDGYLNSWQNALQQ